jgi:hypothetical protein
MSRATRLMAGLILILVPTIELGGAFLLNSLIDLARSGASARRRVRGLARSTGPPRC